MQNEFASDLTQDKRRTVLHVPTLLHAIAVLRESAKQHRSRGDNAHGEQVDRVADELQDLYHNR